MGRQKETEKAREIAFRAMIDGMHFHEVAIADPFKAESEYLDLAREMVRLLGPPKGVRAYTV